MQERDNCLLLAATALQLWLSLSVLGAQGLAVRKVECILCICPHISGFITPLVGACLIYNAVPFSERQFISQSHALI